MLKATVARSFYFISSSALALMASAAFAQQVGTTGAVNPAAQANGRVLQVGSNVLFKERISTTSAGSVQVIFIDKTTLNVGPNSDMVIDEFVYNPNTGTGKMAVTLTKGVLRVVGGNVTHTEGATIKTPVATVGVRGGVATISHSSQTGTKVFNHFGRIDVSSGGATETIRRPGFAVSVANVGGQQTAPSAPIRATAPEIASAISTLTSKPGQIGGATALPTDTKAINSGLGTTTASLTPATTPSVQAQTTSQAATSVVLPTNLTASVTSTVDQTTTTAQQTTTTTQTVTTQAPTTAFYALTTSGTPYLNPAFLTPGMFTSALYGYRRGGTDPTSGVDRYGSKTLQAGLAINGTGANQTSTLFVMAGSMTALSPTDQFQDGGFTASTRRNDAANRGVGFSNGNADSVAGTEVLTSDKLPSSFTLANDNRVTATGATQTQSATYYLSNGLGNQNYTFSNTYTASASPADLGQQRSATTLYGGMAGIMRTGHAASPSGIDSSVGRSFTVGSGLVVQFDASTGRVQANAANVQKTSNPNGDAHEFQSASYQAGSLTAPRARGTYIDDSRFGAREAVSNPADQATNVRVSTVNGQALDGGQQAFVVQDLVNGNSIVTANTSSVTPCVCEYTRWGVWSIQDDRTNSDGSEERDRIHLGWWIAGRLSDPVQIPTTGTATYNGHVVGSVKNSSTNVEYVAAGGFAYNANFGNPNASTVTVNNFDGVSYGGAVGFNRAANTPGANGANPSISGTIGQTGSTNPAVTSGATMALSGNFFQGKTDPIKDVGGTFSIRANSVSTPAGLNHTYIGAGIFAGSR